MKDYIPLDRQNEPLSEAEVQLERLRRTEEAIVDFAQDALERRRARASLTDTFQGRLKTVALSQLRVVADYLIWVAIPVMVVGWLFATLLYLGCPLIDLYTEFLDSILRWFGVAR